MSRRTDRLRSDAGETLIELALTIVILGICSVAIGTGVALSAKISGMHRQQALADEFLHNYAETLQASPYQPCTSASPSYATGLPKPTPGTWSVSQSAISYWNGTAFTSACPAKDQLQEVTLCLQTSSTPTTDCKGALVNETLTVVLRNPS